ncbi:unnamed protein product [Onchocerca flexuosa]|uniref:Muscle M-line assembly protein unc-89 n=1 Tax=Onchocerca flexuosa TaxID=387005 RepID=A0A183H5M4_9BILA|nr:unnamed protein product [Onchocerca flexuosa]
MPLTDCDVLESQELTLVCAVTGIPNPLIKWFKDDKALSETDCTTKYENGVCTLTMDIAKLSDAGVYKCIAENISGASESKCKVQIQPAETTNIKACFKEPLVNISTNSGSEVILECKVVGKPQPKITWYKDGVKLLPENRMLQYLDSNALILFSGSVRLSITDVGANDSGKYSCEAVNTLGKDLCECNVKIIDASAKEPKREEARSSSAIEEELKAPVITRPLEDVTVNEGSRKLLEVEIEAYPEPLIEWFLNSKILEESDTIQTYFDGRLAILKINDAHAEHQGEYLCRAINKGGSAETRCNVAVKEESLAKDQTSKIPKFIEKMQNVKMKNEGDMLTLKCKVSGEPEPEIRWLLNGKAITQDDDRIRIRTFDDGVCIVEVSSVTSEYCGTYTAVAHNIYGDAHANAEVLLDTVEMKMAKKPFFVVEPVRELIVEEGAVLCIACDIDGEAELKVTWFKNHSKIKDDRFVIHKEGINYQFTISSVLLSDEGVYTLKAENTSGKISADVTVHVTPKSEPEVMKEKVDISKPSDTIGQPFVTELTKNSLLLKWEPPEDGDLKTEYAVEQRSYLINHNEFPAIIFANYYNFFEKKNFRLLATKIFFRPDGQVWTQVATSMETELPITGLQPGTEYIFRVAAKNNVGQIIYSPPSVAIMTLPSGKKPVLKNIPPATLILNEKEDIELSVEFEGEPTPFVKWYQDGIELIDGKDTIKITTVSGKSSKLVIKKPKANVHLGLYSCHIGNEAGETVCETRIIKQDAGATAKEVPSEKKELLEGSPQIMVPLSNETTAAGQQFILSCEIKSSPKGVVSWFRNDERLA